ncbi:MAG: DUF2461 family protein, partial [Henriciella sp.]
KRHAYCSRAALLRPGCRLAYAFRDEAGAPGGKDGETLAKILSAFKSESIRLGEPDLKRVPAPYKQDHPRADLLRHKGLTAWIDSLPLATAYGADGPKTCAAEFKRLKPLFDWLLG